METFPDDETGIHRFLDILHAVIRESGKVRLPVEPADLPRLMEEAPNFLAWALRPLSQLFDECALGTRVRAVLAAECGDYALPPSKTPVVLHGGVIAGYMKGAYYPKGGGQVIPAALVAALRANGGELRTRARVERVIVKAGRAAAVRVEGGDEIAASRAIIADVGAPALFLRLLDPEHVPARVQRAMRRFKHGFGTFKMDWALAGPTPWALEEPARAAVVHAADSLDDLAAFTREVRAGALPSHPYLVIGQQSVADPTRAPAGRHTLWAYSHVPSELPGGWEAARERFADRVEDRIEELAPGFRARVLARAIWAPPDLEAMDANLAGGDIAGGSADIRHQLFFRPVFPYFRHRTPVRGLYLGSSYAHPGAGVHGACGRNAALAALHDEG